MRCSSGERAYAVDREKRKRGWITLGIVKVGESKNEMVELMLVD